MGAAAPVLKRRVQDTLALNPVEQRLLLARTLGELDAGYIFKTRPDLAPLVNWSSTRDAPMHRWIRYREAYSPDLIEALGLGQNILDPFCGCGSMLVGAAARGRRATGIDINPLATFVARVKSKPLSEAQLAEVQAFADAFPGNLPERFDPWTPDLSIASKVFEPEILTTLVQLRAAIDGATLAEPSRDFLKLCWIAILEGVGSYFKEGNGIKYRNIQRRPGKYVARAEGWQAKRFGQDQPEFVRRHFLNHLNLMIADTSAWDDAWGDVEIIHGNALDIEELTSSQFDSIVFSPPYANRFDYFESMKVELWFGGFVEDRARLTSLRKASLRSHLASDFSRPNERFDVLEDLINCMDRGASSWRMGVPNLLRGYFSDIVAVLKHCRARLKPEGACYVVVGNSAFGGTIIPSDTLTALAGARAGFTSSEIWVARHLSVAPQQRALLTGFEAFMRESVVVLRP